MRSFTKHHCTYRLQLTNSEQASAHGGQVLVEAMCQRLGLWDKIKQCEHVDPRKRTNQGFAPQAIVAQLLFTLTSGGVSLADAERMGKDQVLLDLIGLDKGADQTTLGEWLRAQTKESVLELMRLNWTVVDQIMAEAKPGRYLRAGCLDTFFDDTEIEVLGKHFEGARINYEGNLALSLQTLWVGPFWLDFILDGAKDPSQYLPELLGQHHARWAGRKSHLFVDSASSSAAYLQAITDAGFTSWSVSYNKWTTVLDRQAEQMPESQWSPSVLGEKTVAQYLWQRHQPGECKQAYDFATVRRKEVGELLWNYGHVASVAGELKSAQLVMERHQLKGALEQRFSEVLSDLDLHHPPCAEQIANQAFYAITMLAYNVLQALKVLEMPDEDQGMRVRSIIRHLLTVPVTISRHARYTTATVCIGAGWLKWWRLFLERWVPKRKPGRPPKEATVTAPARSG
jgi:hypothetical protein